jgi:hypothetical protein
MYLDYIYNKIKLFKIYYALKFFTINIFHVIIMSMAKL